MTEIKLYKSPLKALKLIFLCSIFVAIGVFLILKTDSPKWVGWFSICFFGLGYPIGFFHLFDRRPQIIINELGIYDRTTHDNIINWDIIYDAYLKDINKQKFICLEIDPSYEPSKTKGLIYQGLSHLSKEMGFQELNISLTQIKIDSKKLLDFILKMNAATKTVKQELIAKGLGRT